MANIATQRIKREFKEVIKSEEVTKNFVTYIIVDQCPNLIYFFKYRNRFQLENITYH